MQVNSMQLNRETTLSKVGQKNKFDLLGFFIREEKQLAVQNHFIFRVIELIDMSLKKGYPPPSKILGKKKSV